MAVLIEPSPSPPFKAEREGPAKREGEVGGAANRINRPLHPALPPAATGRRGERVIRSDDWHIFSASAVMTAGVGFAVLAGFGRLATDELVKICAGRSRFPPDKAAPGSTRQTSRRIRPGDLLEIVVLRIRGIGKFDADYPGTVLRLRRVDGGGAPAAGLHPFADFVVVRRDLGHVFLLCRSQPAADAHRGPLAGNRGGRGRVQLTSLGLGL